jgi:hypothetical protein
MRWYTKLTLLLLLAALALPFWLRTPDGRPVMTVDDWLETPSALESVVDEAGDALRSLSGGEAGPTKEEDDGSASGGYYSWQDDAGVWHFSDQPPERLAESLQREPLPEPINRMGAPPVMQEPVELGAGGGNSTELDSSIGVPLPAGVSREAIETLLEEAHERRMGDQR